jgi:geranylgeranyl diphosphate synthase, type II
MKASSNQVSFESAGRAVKEFFEEVRERVDARLDLLVPAGDEEPAVLHSAIRWSLFAGGKRLRPGLVFASGETFSAQPTQLLDTACAFELLHTYSLIHDDLPSMDDDDLRRGLPTCHVKFGEATAILAGDALQALAFQAIARDEGLDSPVRVRLVSELALSAGTSGGMVAGQVLDLMGESREDIEAVELEGIHRRKTGALITAAVRCGGIIAGASDAELEALTRYSQHLGLLFQVTDDLLDVTASAEDIGKTPGKDAQAKKATYPALYGMDGARKRAEELFNEACAALDELNLSTSLLHSIASFTLNRRS